MTTSQDTLDRQPTVPSFDVMGDRFYEDPSQAFAEARALEPVFWHPQVNAWILTRRADIETVLADWTKFSAAGNAERIPVPERYQHVMPSSLIQCILIGSDPPGHTMARRVAQAGFVKPRIDALRPEIEARAGRILDGIAANGSADLMQEYCLELTTQTMLALFGLGPEFEDMIKHVRDDQFQILSSGHAPMEEGDSDLVWDRFIDAQLQLRELVRQRAANPGTDLISDMAAVKDKEGNMLLSVEQIALHVSELAAAGTDTTAQAMANAVIFLDQRPELVAEATTDPTLWDRVFDETIRRRNSTTFTSRTAVEETVIGGVTIPAGDMIFLGLSSANTDPEFHDRPFEFDIHREETGNHLSFGKGRHTCIGQPLARLQGATGLKALYERLSSLTVDPNLPLDFMKIVLLPVRRSLPVHWQVEG
ncbi:cytochrome P450 [Leifsonia kafniensis]|uniref:Cytochrome P450 n=1 Tax=Leifsonia kafniensis TaxID=475957 RepID=A0ABP7KSY7_9MICO